MSSLNNIVKSNKGYEIGHISHRKDGDYKKVGKGEWEKVEDEKKLSLDEYDLPDEKSIELKDKFLKREGVSNVDKLSNKDFLDLSKKFAKEFDIKNLDVAQEILVAKKEDEKAKKSEGEKDLETSKEKTTNPNLNKYDQAYIDGLNNKELVDDVKNAIQKYHHTGNALLNQLYNNDRDLYNKLDKMGDDNAKAFINTIAYDKKYGVSKR